MWYEFLMDTTLALINIKTPLTRNSQWLDILSQAKRVAMEEKHP